MHKNRNLSIIFRVEPGCLGPQGSDHIEKFCKIAQEDFSEIDPELIHWVITPRFDKSLDEIQYKVNNKALSPDQTTKYLMAINRNQAQLEQLLQNRLADLIDNFMEQ